VSESKAEAGGSAEPAEPAESGGSGGIGARLAALRRRYGWLDHLIRSWTLFQTNLGNHFAAAVTLFSFLALFPLVLLAVSVAGFVLQAQPDLQNQLFDKIAENVPGAFGDTLSESIDQAIRARAGVGLIGLGGLLYTGLGWVSNLRQAIEGVWGKTPPKRPFILAKLGDLLVLIGLGIGAVLSIGVSAVGSTLTSTVLDALHLNDVPGLFVVTKVIGILLGLSGSFLIFGWLLMRLPQSDVPPSVGVQAALIAAAGFEVLKLAGTLLITRATQSPTAGIFASVVGILVWINLVARFLLLCVAWTATDPETVAAEAEARDDTQPAPSVAAQRLGPEREPGPAVSPAATAAALVGAGAVLGAGATVGAAHWWQVRRR